ncbi:hypothetical protein FG386_003502 [Cryptosporidium ryanae]|uniref:uncharacterized protein n=1 Tax=Cryptosporidium ryanae TaxID=515981 RepID=UPI00351A6DFC|nr:hypothetical protein FG386_003502 [Cryptosporidium ryanae]
MESKIVLGGRGNLGIVNTLRRQIIHIINWELNTSKDKNVILELLLLLITSVGSEHYRSLTAIEILQCIDNVLKKFVNSETQSGWILLLSNIGKHNVIFRDYVLYCTLYILKDQDKNSTLQNLESKCIHWRLSKNLLYILYNVVLRDEDISNEDVRRCMNSFLCERIVPPRQLIDIYLKKNTLRSLISNSNFFISSSFVSYILNKLNSASKNKVIALEGNELSAENESETDENDKNESEAYVEALISNQKEIDKMLFQRINCNPFKSNINRTIRCFVMQKGNFTQDEGGFLHHLLFKSVVDSVNTSPWNVNHWRDLYHSLKNFTLFLTKVKVLDKAFNSNGLFFGLSEHNSPQHNENQLYYHKLVHYFIKNYGSESNTFSGESGSHSDSVNCVGIRRSIDTLKNMIIKKQLYYRYFNFGSPEHWNKMSEMLLLRIKVYTLLCVIGEINEVCYIKNSELAPHMSQDSVSTQDLDHNFCGRSVFWGYFTTKNNTSGDDHSSLSYFSREPLLFSTISLLFNHIPRRDLHSFLQDFFDINGEKGKRYLFISEYWQSFENRVKKDNLRRKSSPYR